MALRAVLICSAFLVFCNAVEIQHLGGQWLLKDESGKYKDLKAIVPGGIYSDLMDNDIIENIFYGYNDDVTRWVPRTNWTYYTNFTVNEELLNFENINIVFEGLDTFATIAINDVVVGQSKNMFVQYVFNVKDQIQAGNNVIEVRFQSPIEVAENLSAEQNKSYNIPVNCPPSAYRGECHVNMIRKMQASYSWDWGPSFPSVGIWKDLYIEAYNETAVRYIVPDVVQSEDNSSWTVLVDVYFANNAKKVIFGKIAFELELDSETVTQSVTVNLIPNGLNEVVVHNYSIKVDSGLLKTWWPNGFGAQNLYNLTVTYSNDEETEKSSKTVRIGFRTIELVQDTLDSGLTFYFKVNGVPIFMKGSNEIPIDILPERGQNKETIRKLLTTASDSHMNMLRVWGGGVYESDYFYDLADELGILIWQDFMFACSLYPTNEEYLNNVLDEVRHQVKRLSSHASIALYSGNNENEGALVDDWYGVRNNFTLFKADYVKLYIDTIMNEFVRLTNNRSIFVSSSPSNGKETESEGYVAAHPSSTFYGDVHYYNYIMDSFNSVIFPVPRFASEYGYQSLPSVNSFLTVTNSTSDLNINSEFMDHRQHHPVGNSELKSLISHQFTLPNENSENYYKAFIYYSQIVQAVSIRVETEHYRRYRSSLNAGGEGYTMGALYWQLNDVWVAPTWSGIDHTGKWKMLQYYTQEFFAPIIITGHINAERTLETYIVSDLLSPVLNVTASIQVYNWSSLDSILEKKLTDLEAGKSHLIDSFDIDDFLTDAKCGELNTARYNCLIYLTLYKEGIRIAPDNFVLPDKIKSSRVQQPKLQLSGVTKQSDEGIYEIEITTDNIALFVWLDTNKIKGRFSDNGFLQVNESRKVYFYSEEETTAEDLQKDLTITNLLDDEYVTS
uniref:Beta-mannosidase B n=1 Tax=Anoplophora glabripennis TaxID=217634 RepID=V5GTZ4_ANOGL